MAGINSEFSINKDTFGNNILVQDLSTGVPGYPQVIAGTTLPTSGNYYKGCLMFKTDVATGFNGVYSNTGTTTAPVFTVLNVGNLTNYIATENGANNAIAGTLTDSSGTNITLVAGVRVLIKLAHTLQAGANTFNLNGGGAVAIKSHLDVANDIATAYAVGSIVSLVYDGTQWQDLSQ